MATQSPSEMTLEAIRSVPLFASLDNEAARELRDLLRTREISAGAVLFCTGDDGDAMYLIESGRVRITITDEDQKEITLAELAQGDFFGEMAIIDGKPRSADAKIIEDTRLEVLSRADFLKFTRNNPTVALEMLSATLLACDAPTNSCNSVSHATSTRNKRSAVRSPTALLIWLPRLAGVGHTLAPS